MNDPTKTLLADLGYLSMAKIRFSTSSNRTPELQIVSASYEEEGAAVPAQSVSMLGWLAIESLHSILSEALKSKPTDPKP